VDHFAVIDGRDGAAGVVEEVDAGIDPQHVIDGVMSPGRSASELSGDACCPAVHWSARRKQPNALRR
jgi:hypothetical protein